ncbi:MAG: S8 family serine peptidase [Pseudomonadota bacterium]
MLITAVVGLALGVSGYALFVAGQVPGIADPDGSVLLSTAAPDGASAPRAVSAVGGTVLSTSSEVSAGGRSEKPAAASSSNVQSSLAELAARESTAGPAAAAAFASERGLKYGDGLVQAVLDTAAGAEQSVAGRVTEAGGTVETTAKGMVQARLPVAGLEALAASAAVESVREPRRPVISAVSEGVADIGASTWHTEGANGAGTKIAVLDPGFTGYDQLVAAGELPANVITASFVTGGDINGGGEVHGSACAEIVYDTAPGAQLYLVNFSTDAELANAIDYVIAQDIDIVSASWGFYGSFRGDGQGPIDDMVQTANAAGVFWAVASGNAAMSHWSGPFVDNDSDNLLEYSGTDEGNDVNASAGSEIHAFLTWNKWPVTDQDYDMYLWYEGGQPGVPVAAGASWQSGTQEPAEELHYVVPAGKSGRYWITVENFSATGDAQFQLLTYPQTLEYRVAAGSLGGQPSDSPYVMTVGAVPVGGTTIETFSSQGPTLDGRIKPDLVAPDRVSTSTYGAGAFYGTSAAAPHAAGAAALVKGWQAATTPAEVQTFLEGRATDLGAAGKDSVYGSGKLAMGAVPLLCGQPSLSLSGASSYWDSYADYQARVLSVDFSLCNSAAIDAVNVNIVGVINTNSVIVLSSLPFAVGDIDGPPGGNPPVCSQVTQRFFVPPGISRFRSANFVTAEDRCGASYAYPAPFPGV